MIQGVQAWRKDKQLIFAPSICDVNFAASLRLFVSGIHEHRKHCIQKEADLLGKTDSKRICLNVLKLCNVATLYASEIACQLKNGNLVQ